MLVLKAPLNLTPDNLMSPSGSNHANHDVDSVMGDGFCLECVNNRINATSVVAQPNTQSLAHYKPTIGDTMPLSMKASPSNERNVFKGQLVDIATNVTGAELTCCFTRQAARDFTIDELAIALSQIPEQHRLDGNITIKLLVEEGFLVEDQHIAAITIGENGQLQLHKFNESLELIVTDSYDDACTCVEIDLEML